MANTRHHAYADRPGAPTYARKWWLVATRDPGAQAVHFCFMDNGLGIPRTVRTKFYEILGKGAGMLAGRGELQDAQVIRSAMLGEKMLSATGETHRGHGLPSIWEAQVAGDIDDLHVVSRRGMIDDNAQPVPLDDDFYGTLISWRMRNGPNR